MKFFFFENRYDPLASSCGQGVRDEVTIRSHIHMGGRSCRDHLRPQRWGCDLLTTTQTTATFLIAWMVISFPSQPFPTLEGNSFASHARLPCLVFERTHSKEASKQNWKSPKSRFHLHKLCTTKEKINVCDNTEGVRRRNKQTPPAFFPHRALSFEP